MEFVIRKYNGQLHAHTEAAKPTRVREQMGEEKFRVTLTEEQEGKSLAELKFIFGEQIKALEKAVGS